MNSSFTFRKIYFKNYVHKKDISKSINTCRCRIFFAAKISNGRDSKIAKARIGFIGVGLRGQDHLELALRRDDVDVIAICDIQQTMIDASIELIKKSGRQFLENI